MENRELLKRCSVGCLRKLQILAAVAGALITIIVNQLVLGLDSHSNRPAMDWCLIITWGLLGAPAFTICRLLGLPWAGSDYGVSGFELLLTVLINSLLLFTIVTVAGWIVGILANRNK